MNFEKWVLLNLEDDSIREFFAERMIETYMRYMYKLLRV